MKTAADFNAEEAKKKEAKAKAEEMKEKKPVMSKDGKYMCANKGCADIKFNLEDNGPTACKHHLGEPVFHDLKKYWSCCTGKPAYDWEEFMKLPKCAVG